MKYLSVVYCLNIAAQVQGGPAGYPFPAEATDATARHLIHLKNSLLSKIENWDHDDILFAMGQDEPEYHDMVDDKVTIIITYQLF